MVVGKLDGAGCVTRPEALAYGAGMTVIRLRDEGQDEGRKLLEIAEARLREMLEDLDACAAYWRDRDDLSETELKRVLTNVAKSVQHVFDERKRFDDLRKKKLGLVQDFAIDLDAARDTIGRKLDRLRDARVPDAVPGSDVGG